MGWVSHADKCDSDGGHDSVGGEHIGLELEDRLEEIISHNRSKSWVARVSSRLGMLMIGPLLVGVVESKSMEERDKIKQM